MTSHGLFIAFLILCLIAGRRFAETHEWPVALTAACYILLILIFVLVWVDCYRQGKLERRTEEVDLAGIQILLNLLLYTGRRYLSPFFLTFTRGAGFGQPLSSTIGRVAVRELVARRLRSPFYVIGMICLLGLFFGYLLTPDNPVILGFSRTLGQMWGFTVYTALLLILQLNLAFDFFITIYCVVSPKRGQ